MQWTAEDRQNVAVADHEQIQQYLMRAFFPKHPEVLAYPEELIHTPLLILGPVGCGKTEAITAFAKQHDLGFKEIRLSNHDVTDLMGLPTVHREVNADDGRVTDVKVEWARCGLLPNENDPDFKEKGILFLDEITNADKNVSKVAWQLTDASRKVGDTKLPKGWMVVLAGNGPRDGGAYVDLETAVFTRCASMRLEPDFTGWKRWALSKGKVDPVLIAFLQMNNESLWGGQKTVEDLENGCVSPTPRSWTLCSRLIKSMGDSVDYSSVLSMARHTVGEPEASNFAAFFENRKEMADIEGMLAGTTPITKEQFQGKSREVIYIQQNAIAQGFYSGIMADINADYNNDAEFDRAMRAANIVMAISEVTVDAAISIARTTIDLFSSTGDGQLWAEWTINRMHLIAAKCPAWNRFFSDNADIMV